jgi:hypothetical protein
VCMFVRVYARLCDDLQQPHTISNGPCVAGGELLPDALAGDELLCVCVCICGSV